MFRVDTRGIIGVIHNCADGNDEFLSIPLEVEWYYRSCVHALARQWPLCVKGHVWVPEFLRKFVMVLFLKNFLQWSVFAM